MRQKRIKVEEESEKEDEKEGEKARVRVSERALVYVLEFCRNVFVKNENTAAGT